MRDDQKSVLVINGPNLNLLGIREPHIYGHETLQDVETKGVEQGKALNAHVDFFQRWVDGFIIAPNFVALESC